MGEFPRRVVRPHGRAFAYAGLTNRSPRHAHPLGGGGQSGESCIEL